VTTVSIALGGSSPPATCVASRILPTADRTCSSRQARRHELGTAGLLQNTIREISENSNVRSTRFTTC
jgi:hypothetical protein